MGSIVNQDAKGAYAISNGRKFYYRQNEPEGSERAKRKADKAEKAQKITDLAKIDNSRSIFMFGDFDQASSEKIVSRLLELDSVNKDTINLFINSYGGEVFSLYSILDTIDGIGSPVNTICLGEADSCGSLLLSYGANRYIGSKSRVMVHGVSIGKMFSSENEGSTAEMLKHIQEQNAKIGNILYENSAKTDDVIKQMLSNDTFMDSAVALSHGLVDYVLEVSCEESEDIGEFKNTFASDARLLAVYNSKVHAKVDSKIKTKVLEKGEETMNKEEVLAMFNSLGQFKDINEAVEFATNTINTLKVDKDSLQAALDKVTADMNALQDKVEQDNINSLLESMIAEAKSTQVMNDTVYKNYFTSIGYEKAKEVAKAIPTVAKLTPEHVQEVGETTNEEGFRMREFNEISNIAKTQNISFDQAERIWQKQRKED
jgi:ATP-dependent Clp protease, protease subunit